MIALRSYIPNFALIADILEVCEFGGIYIIPTAPVEGEKYE